MMTKTKTVGNAQHLESLFPSPQEGVRTFSSFWSSPEKLAESIKQKGKRGWHQSGWEDHDGDFYGTNTMKEALQLVEDGWREGIERVAKLQGKVMAKYPLQSKPAKYGVVGAMPSVPRAVAGNPLNMKVFDPKKSSKRPIITLVSDMSADCSHDRVEFVNRAAVVAALIDHIESLGYACEVIAVAYSQSERMQVKSHIMVKECNQPVDIAKLSFGLGHTAMFRRLVFAEWGTYSFNEELGYGLGYNLHFKLGSKEQKYLEEKHIYVIPSVNGNRFFRTEESAEEQGLPYILSSLKKQKFPVFDYKGVPDIENKDEDD